MLSSYIVDTECERADHLLQRDPQVIEVVVIEFLLNALICNRLAVATDQMPPIRSDENLRAYDRAVESRRTVRKSRSDLLLYRADIYGNLHCQGRRPTSTIG
jgi:hypothetical protein